MQPSAEEVSFCGPVALTADSGRIDRSDSCGNVISDMKLSSIREPEDSKPLSKSGVSNFGAVSNILTTAVGVGMLAIPNAIAQAGFIPGFLMFAICTGISLLCCKLLQEAMWSAMDIQSRRDSMKEVRTYEDVGTLAYGRLGRLGVSMALHSALVGCSCIIALLMGKAMYRLVPSVSQAAWIVISCSVMLPFVWLRTMKHIGFVSATLGTASIAALTVTVVVSGFLFFSSQDGPCDWIEESPTRSYSAWNSSLLGLGTAFGTLTFSFAVTCTLPTILYDLQRKNDAGKVIIAGVSVTSAVYGVVAMCGYIGFGSLLTAKGVEDVLSVVQPGTRIAICTDVLVLLVCVTHYAVIINPSCRKLEDSIAWARGNVFRSSLIRTLLVVLTALVAIFCGKFTALVDLIGSISFACVHMVFPPLFYLKLRSIQGLTNWSTTREKTVTFCCGLLVFLAILGGTIGSVSSIMRFMDS